MKRIMFMSVAAGIVLLLASLLSLGSIGADWPAQATITPTAFSYLPLVVKNPRPQFSPDSFVFPFDMAQVIAIRSQMPGVEPYFIYHITDRPDSNDPCGRHPGDCLIPLINVAGELDDFDIPVIMPYDGVLERSWVTDPVGEHSGADLGFTFYVGDMGGHAYYLDVYHTDTSPLEIGDVVTAGQVFAHLNRAKFSFGPWESKIHITLLVDGTDFMSTETADIAPFALPGTLKAAHLQGQSVAIVYEGPNFCNMTSPEKIARIVNDYLPNAGFCTDGALVTYCGSDPRFQGLSFTQRQLPPHWDGRGIELVPQPQ